MLPPSAALHPLAATATNLFYRRISMNFFNFAISFFFFPFLSCSLSDFGIVAFKLDSSPAFFFLTTFSFVIFHLDLGWRASVVILSISHCRGYVQSTLHLHCFIDSPLFTFVVSVPH